MTGHHDNYMKMTSAQKTSENGPGKGETCQRQQADPSQQFDVRQSHLPCTTKAFVSRCRCPRWWTENKWFSMLFTLTMSARTSYLGRQLVQGHRGERFINAREAHPVPVSVHAVITRTSGILPKFLSHISVK